MAMNRIAVLKAYFGSEGYPPVTTAELKALSAQERQELAEGAAKEMGVELETTASPQLAQ